MGDYCDLPPLVDVMSLLFPNLKRLKSVSSLCPIQNEKERESERMKRLYLLYREESKSSTKVKKNVGFKSAIIGDQIETDGERTWIG